MPVEDYDVIIVGAGVVGAAMALLLAESGFTVIVLERDELVSKCEPGEYGGRVSAINLGAERFLSKLNIWPELSAQGVSPYERMYVWDAGSSGRIEFDCADYGLTHLGTIVENNLLISLLHQRLLLESNITVLTNIQMHKIKQGENAVAVAWRDAGSACAKVLVGADGAGSWVRKSLAMRVKTASYGQSGIVAQVSTERDHEKTAWQRFLSTGPLAFLPLSNGDCSIVWSCEQDMAGELMALGDTDFIQRLSASSEFKLGKVISTGPRKAYPLCSAYVPHYVHQRSALIGDAAHVVHPLAGQGVNLGLTDAAALAEVLIKARAKKRDIGQQLTLRRYERWRKGDNLLMLSALTGLKTLFGAKSYPAAKLREIGLNAVDGLDPLKSFLANKAMGISGDLPEIMTTNSG